MDNETLSAIYLSSKNIGYTKEENVIAKQEIVEKPKVVPVEKKEAAKPVEPKREKLNSDGELVPDEKVATKYQKLTGPKQIGEKIQLLVDKEFNQSELIDLWNNDAFSKNQVSEFDNPQKILVYIDFPQSLFFDRLFYQLNILS